MRTKDKVQQRNTVHKGVRGKKKTTVDADVDVLSSPGCLPLVSAGDINSDLVTTTCDVAQREEKYENSLFGSWVNALLYPDRKSPKKETLEERYH